MGFETKFSQLPIHLISHYKAVPMGFETFSKHNKIYRKYYYKAVPMGFETRLLFFC